MQECRHFEPSVQLSVQEWLGLFYKNWPQQHDFSTDAEKENTWLKSLDPSAIEALLNYIEPYLSRVPMGEMSFNPWRVAGLARKEVVNASVLNWLLDPSGSHGLQALPINALLSLLNEEVPEEFPLSYSQWCRLNTEVLPSGDKRNRVDIEIDADTFYVLIEIKIDASDQPDQLLRYCHEAKSRAGKRPWRVVYLTPHGRMSANLQGKKIHGVVPLSWRRLSDHQARTLRHEFRREKVQQDPSVLVARQSVRHFLDHIRDF